MKTRDLISIQQVCVHYNVPTSFVTALNDYELIDIITIQNILYISKTQVKDFEKMMHLHYELEINIEGIDAIYNLLKQVETLQNEITTLNNSLNFYKAIKS